MTSPDRRSARGLDRRVAQAFFGNFNELRPAQAEAIAPIQAGHDAVILAGTGSGKTEAATAPVVSRVLGALLAATRPVVVYVAPTRALVNDIHRRLEPPLESLGVRLGVRHYDRDDLARVNKPAVLITTPESLDVLLWKQPTVLSDVEAVIVDEAHLLYNTQRGLQTAILIHRLELMRGDQIQVVALSATVADGDAIWEFLRPGREVAVVHDDSVRRIDHHVRIGIEPGDLAALLRRYSSESGFKVLVFVDSRRVCDELATALRGDSGFGNSVFVHHSSLSKDERLRTESSFLQSARAICVATSTLELGIDIGNISLIVLWGRATGWESFLQRIGRGGRRADIVNVICAVPPDAAGDLTGAFGFQALFRQVASGHFDAERPRTLFGAACQQIVSVATRDGGFHPVSEFATMLSPWPHLTLDVVREVLEDLTRADYLLRHPVRREYGAGAKAHALAERNEVWGNFPRSTTIVKVVDRQHRHLGDLPADNLSLLDVGAVFTLVGRSLKVIGTQRDRVVTVPSPERASVQIRYGGGMAEVDPTLVESVFELVRAGGGADVSPTAARIRLTEAVQGLPPDIGSVVPFRETRNGYRYLTFGGLMFNQLLSWWTNGDPATASEIEFGSRIPIDFGRLPRRILDFDRALAAVTPSAERLTTFQELLPAHLRASEALDLWRKRPVYERTLFRLRSSRPVRIDPIPNISFG